MRLISERYRPWLIYTACSLCSLAFFTSNLRGGIVAEKIESGILSVMSPFYLCMDWGLDNISFYWSHYVFLVNVQHENQKLKKDLAQLQAEQMILLERIQLAERYLTLVQLPSSVTHEKIVADVVHRGSHTWDSILIINKGQNDGVQKYMGVSGQDGVIGQIARVSPNLSKVVTLIHPQSGIAALLQKSRVSGIVNGSGDGKCILKFASRFDRVILGETVITSGLDDAFPKGLPIGQVIRIDRQPGDIFQTVEILPFSDMSVIEEVVIYKPLRNGEFDE
ncbi:rod shape-determining protein MreC [bacterium]|nr:rod shape-determining protein MreC [candidate division CSSED10-310 bacterium]